MNQPEEVLLKLGPPPWWGEGRIWEERVDGPIERVREELQRAGQAVEWATLRRRGEVIRINPFAVRSIE